MRTQAQTCICWFKYTTDNKSYSHLEAGLASLFGSKPVIIPLVIKASREVANLMKKRHIQPYSVSKICLSVTNFDLDYLRTG